MALFFDSTVLGSSATVELPDLPSGLAHVRANVKLAPGDIPFTEWEEIMIAWLMYTEI